MVWIEIKITNSPTNVERLQADARLGGPGRQPGRDGRGTDPAGVALELLSASEILVSFSIILIGLDIGVLSLLGPFPTFVLL